MPKLTLKTFRELTSSLPEDTPLYYHAYDKGCCLNSYAEADFWLFPQGQPTQAIVLNPGEDYDPRRPKPPHPHERPRRPKNRQHTSPTGAVHGLWTP